VRLCMRRSTRSQTLLLLLQRPSMRPHAAVNLGHACQLQPGVVLMLLAFFACCLGSSLLVLACMRVRLTHAVAAAPAACPAAPAPNTVTSTVTT
jgi:hypothetical protein